MSSPHHQDDQAHQLIMPQQDVIVHTFAYPDDICLVVIDHMGDTKDFRLLGPKAYLFVNKVERDRYLDAFYKHLAHSRDSRDLTRLTKNRPELHLNFLIMSRHELFIQYHDSNMKVLHDFVRHCRTLCEEVQLEGEDPVLTHILVNVNDLHIYKTLIDDHVRHGHTHHVKLVPQLGPDCTNINQEKKEDVDKVYKDIIEPALQHSRQLILSHSLRRTSPTRLPHHGGGHIKEGDVLAQCLIKFSESSLQSRIHTLVLEDYPFIKKLLWLSHFPKLRVLSLRGASLGGAASKALNQLHDLESLNLDNCGLSLISARTGELRPFWTDVSLPVSLRQLSLQNNDLESEVFDMLKNLINLEALNLQVNNITDIPNSNHILPKLAHIDITHNLEFTDFSGITNFKKVKQLDCTRNDTTDFLASLGWLNRKRELHTVYHHIEEFVFQALRELTPPYCIYLSNFTNLKVLDLGHAANIDFGSDIEDTHRPYRFSVMPHVHTLKLRHSTFEKVDSALEGLKRKFPVLQHLDLHDCGLRWTSFTSESILNLDGLGDLNLSKNTLLLEYQDRKKCSAEFYKRLRTITTLKIVHLASCGLVAPAEDFKSHIHFVEDDPGAHSRHT